jgi:hypothetical protein
MPEFLYLLLFIAAVYAAGWLFERIGRLLGSNPTALGWNDQPYRSGSTASHGHPALGTPGQHDWMRLDETTRFPTSANRYGELPIDLTDDHDH